MQFVDSLHYLDVSTKTWHLFTGGKKNSKELTVPEARMAASICYDECS